MSSILVGYKPYTGAIDTNSARYKRAKAMYDEGHSMHLSLLRKRRMKRQCRR